MVNARAPYLCGRHNCLIIKSVAGNRFAVAGFDPAVGAGALRDATAGPGSGS
jgi:hypothetical protein